MSALATRTCCDPASRTRRTRTRTGTRTSLRPQPGVLRRWHGEVAQFVRQLASVDGRQIAGPNGRCGSGAAGAARGDCQTRRSHYELMQRRSRGTAPAGNPCACRAAGLPAAARCRQCQATAFRQAGGLARRSGPRRCSRSRAGCASGSTRPGPAPRRATAAQGCGCAARR